MRGGHPPRRVPEQHVRTHAPAPHQPVLGDLDTFFPEAAGTLLHVPHRMLALGGADGPDAVSLARAVRDLPR